jgi:DinB superfamily
MIVPDEKDWTWVLDRPCPECGFDAGRVPATDVAALTLANAQTWQDLLADGQIRPGRPDDATWSSLEYACHVRDVFVRYDERIALMQRDDDPLFPNWDQDASAVEDNYEGQDPTLVVDELAVAAAALAARLSAMDEDEWSRPGRRSDGASFTIATIARYMIHDPVHHIWDVTRTH